MTCDLPADRHWTLEQRQRLHRLADLGRLVMIAGLDAYPPDFLLGILVEVAATVPRARLESRRAEKRLGRPDLEPNTCIDST